MTILDVYEPDNNDLSIFLSILNGEDVSVQEVKDESEWELDVDAVVFESVLEIYQPSIGSFHGVCIDFGA